MLGTIVFPGARVWHRNPVAGSILFSLGVTAPAFVVALFYQHRHDVESLLDRGWVLRGVVVVLVLAIITRFAAVVMTAPDVARTSQPNFRLRGFSLVALLAVPTGYTAWAINRTQAAVDTVFSVGDGQTKVTAKKDELSSKIHTTLLIGSDGGIGRVGVRTDTMMLVFVDERSGRGALFSIPRQLVNVTWPAGSAAAAKWPDGLKVLQDVKYQGKIIRHKGDPEWTNAINNAVNTDKELAKAYNTNNDGMPGVHALIEGLSNSFDITIDDFAVIDSCVVVDVIEAVGGVTVNIPYKMVMPHGHFECIKRSIEDTIGPGPVFLDGPLAWGFLRIREQDTDYARMARQRQLIQAIIDRVGIAKVLANWSEMTSAVVKDVRTSMSVTRAKQMMTVLKRGGAKLGSYGLTKKFHPDSSPDFVAAHEIIQSIKQGLIDGVKPTTLSTIVSS